MLLLLDKKSLLRLVFASIGILLLAACGYNPKHESLPLVLSEKWQAEEESIKTYASENKEWWLSFQSPELDALIVKSLESNPDVLMAQQRILQAEAQLGITRANNLPHLDASGSVGFSKSNDSGSNKSSSLGLSTSYEVDLWGRIAAERYASESTLESKVYDWHSTQLTLSTSVASSWFQWLTLGEQLENARWYLEASEQQLGFIKSAYDLGSATLVELARQRKQVLTRSANLRKIRNQRLQVRNALALLLGESPQYYNPPQAKLLQLHIPKPNPGLPTDIITRRPDLAREEALLRAMDANLAVARKAIYPSFSLKSSARLASDSLGLADPTQTFSLGADIIQSIFDFGLRSRQIELSEAKQKEMLLSYYKSVLTALAEVEDALSDEQLSRELERQQKQLIKENYTISSNTERLYKAGSETLTNLLDAQLEEMQAKDTLFELYQGRLDASLTLYKVLGGGWKP